MAFRRYKPSKIERVRLNKEERQRLRAIRWLRNNPENEEQENNAAEVEYLHDMVERRNAYTAVLCILLMERVGIDYRETDERESEHTVIKRVPRDTSTSTQSLYASLLLQSLLDDNPDLDPTIKRWLKNFQFEDGTTLNLQPVC